MITMLITVLFFVSIIALIYALFRMKHLVNQIRILKKENDILDVAKQKFHSQMDEARLECDRLTAEIDQYKTKLETLSNDKKILEEVQHSLNIQLNEASQEKNVCLEEIKKLKALIAEKDEEIKGKDLEINKLIEDKKCLEKRFEDSNKEGNFDGDALDALVEELNKGSKEKQEEYEAWYSRLMAMSDEEFREEHINYLTSSKKDFDHLQKQQAVWEIYDKRLNIAREKAETERRIQREKEQRELEIRREQIAKERERETQRRAKEREVKVKSYFDDLSKSAKAISGKVSWHISGDNIFYTLSINEDADLNTAFRLIDRHGLSFGLSFVSTNPTLEVRSNDGKLLLSIRPSYIHTGGTFSGRLKSTYEISFRSEHRDALVFKESETKDPKKLAEKFVSCYLKNRKLSEIDQEWSNILQNGIERVDKIDSIDKEVDIHSQNILMQSDYNGLFTKDVFCAFENDILMIEYELPAIEEFNRIKEYKHIASTNDVTIKYHSDSYVNSLYEQAIYAISLRSIYEVLVKDNAKKIQNVVFNGFVTSASKATGKTARKCIMSIQIDRDKFMSIDLAHVTPKVCFKSLKGVSAAQILEMTPIIPILTFNRDDRRFIEGRSISFDQGTNLAAMHWEDFEQLVRELFELEFAKNGGEVRVTQASRDGGVDAVVFDPDPLRGGKIVIQAKRYTNTVGVSAVRDLYGTVINEGANSGILITTSDYGHDSYEFAKDKPLKLLNGGHLLAMIRKHGRKAYINIQEAKESIAGK